jgi:hypothetical protein
VGSRPTPISKSQPLPPPKVESTNRLSLIVGIVAIIVVLGSLVFFLFINNNNQQPTPTALVVAEATETEEATEAVIIPAVTDSESVTPTSDATDAPDATNTPTDRPSNTPRPSPSPTESDTDTPEPTDTPEETVVAVVPTDAPSATPEEPNVVLYYDHRTFALVNRADESVNISDLYFIRTDEAGQSYQFASNDWTNDDTLSSFRTQNCLQVWTSDFTFLEEDRAVCRNRQGWRQLNTARLFWVSNEESATFEIRRGSSQVLATCPTSPSSGTADFEYECAVDVNIER